MWILIRLQVRWGYNRNRMIYTKNSKRMGETSRWFPGKRQRAGETSPKSIAAPGNSDLGIQYESFTPPPPLALEK